jgi:hypothetical protein
MDELATLIAKATKQQIECAEGIDDVLELVKCLLLDQHDGMRARGAVLGWFEVPQGKVAETISALEELDACLAERGYR